MRNGVSPSLVALPAGPWPTVLDFLADRLPAVSRDQWRQRLQAGEVLSEDGTPVAAQALFQHGRRLYYYRHLAHEPELPEHETLLFEDAHLLVVDKPHFMPVTPTGRYVQQSLLVRLKRSTGCETLSPIHRIDRETAGVVLLAKRPEDRNAYQAMFRDRQVRKVYEAVTAHRPGLVAPKVHRSRLVEDERFFRMREVPGEANSETGLALLHAWEGRALYRLTPVTGKRHQLRVHMMALGMPIEGDRFYPEVLRGPDEAEDFSRPLQLLAREIAFTDPVTRQPRHFASQRRLTLADMPVSPVSP